MAPIEFEKKIKEFLEERNIKPSEDSWNKIYLSLELKPRRSKSGVFRYSIAAAVAGVLLVTIWAIRKTGDTAIEAMPVVEEAPMNDPITDPETNKGVIPTLLVNASSDEKEVLDPPVQEHENTVIEYKDLALEANKPQESMVIVGNSTGSFVETNVSEEVTRLKLEKENKDAVIETEVNSLLRNAQKELLAEKQFREENNIEASSLLAGVEDELNESFRDQVFEKLKQGFVKVRTAVADRNN